MLLPAPKRPAPGERYRVEFRDAIYTVNVRKAFELVLQGRSDPVYLPVSTFAPQLIYHRKDPFTDRPFFGPNAPDGPAYGINRVDWDHVEHANPGVPGIGCFLHERFVLIDGKHRLARAYQKNQQLWAIYLLTPDALQECLTITRNVL